MELSFYLAVCPGCHFTAGMGSGSGLTPKEHQALLLLASHAGKVILVYADLRQIAENSTQAIMHHPSFNKSEYQQLLSFYNSLADKCEGILAAQTPLSWNDVMGS
jgi:hypothetical protein